MNARSAAVSLTVATTLLTPSHLSAQSSVFLGRVLSDSGMVLHRAEVVLNGPQNLQRTYERGEFKFSSVPAGTQIVGVRMPGYAPRVDTIEVADAGEVRREYRLSRIVATLPEVPVTATILDRKLYEFYNRRKFGMGRSLTARSSRRRTARAHRTSSHNWPAS